MLAFPEEVFHMFDFMGTDTDQIITQTRGGSVKIYGHRDAPKRAPSAARLDPVYRAHSVSNHTHY
jgi:hypothetical protein